METGGEIGSKTPSSLLMSSSVAPFLAPFPSKLGNHRENAGTPNNQPHIHPKKVGIYWVYPLSPRAPTGGYPTGRVIVHHLAPITGQPIIDSWCCWRFFGGHRTRGVRHKKLRESRSQVIFPSRKIQVTQRFLFKKSWENWLLKHTKVKHAIKTKDKHNICLHVFANLRGAVGSFFSSAITKIPAKLPAPNMFWLSPPAKTGWSLLRSIRLRRPNPRCIGKDLDLRVKQPWFLMKLEK